MTQDHSSPPFLNDRKLKVELQRKDASRVFMAVGLYMVVAWRGLDLMKLERISPKISPDLVVEEDE